MMANLFNKHILKKEIENYLVSNQQEKLDLIKQRLDMHKSGFLASKTETESEQAFNDSFFVQILGYEAIPNNPFTIEPKGKNEIGGQKADAILGYFTTNIENLALNGKDNLSRVQAVVEIKDSKTSLDKPQKREGNLSPVQQGFKYKPQYSNCKWVIVSNFYEIRLYKDTMLDYEIWNLNDLLESDNNFERFRIFHFLLSAQNLISSVGESNTEKLLSQVRYQQEKITKEFYEKYKKLRLELINDIKNNNIDINIETVIAKSQKIIDRLVFIFFCEDRDLLPQGKVNQYVQKAREMDFSPWDLLKKVFKGVDKGSKMLEIPEPGYNGGLFAVDAVLENLEVSDEICHKFLELGKYDFEEEISINVLGHIFEQSISDLEELKIDMLGTKMGTGELGETTKHSKRKKDGIFYTPEYIIDYIVRNSLGKYLEEKESELKEKFGLKEDIQDKNYEKRVMEVYQEYQKILQNIKVLDPACGSGAFLVKVYDFLYNENKRVIEILSKGLQPLVQNKSKTEQPLVQTGLFDKDSLVKDILQNNIYGVDLNEESVEITKLSLWLKTAEKGKQLASLGNNIKYGNSLIDDESVAGKKAFKREKEFKQVFKKKEIKTWMITRATHNTRISERMIEVGVKLGDPIIMDENMEIEITGYISEIVQEDKLTVLAYNICKDHVHIILQCAEIERDNIVRKLKGKTTQLYKKNHNIKDKLYLRGQKYNHSEIKDEKYFFNTMEYVKTNREHYGLQTLYHNKSKGLQPLVQTNGERIFVTKNYNFDRIEYKYFGGFDVIVGNPPYVRAHNIKENEKRFLRNNYETIEAKSDLYACFVERSNFLLKKGGYFSFILPQTWLSLESFVKLRKFVIENYGIVSFDFYDYMVFEQAQVETTVFIFQKGQKIKETKINNNTKKGEIKTIIKNYKDLVDENYNFKVFSSNDIDIVLKKIEKKGEKLENFINFKYGLKTGDDEKFVHFEKKFDNDKKLIRIKDIGRYQIEFKGEYVNYEPEEMRKRKNTARPGEPERFEQEKILIMSIATKLIATYDKDDFYVKDCLILLKKGDNVFLKYILSIINSGLLGFYYQNRFQVINVVKNAFLQLPIPEIPLTSQQPFIEKADKMLELNKQFHEAVDFVLRFLQSKFGIGKVSNKLQKFWELDFAEFTKQLKIRKIGMEQEAELMSFFEKKKSEILVIKDEIDNTDSEIDSMVFDLYGFSGEEKKIVLGK